MIQGSKGTSLDGTSQPAEVRRAPLQGRAEEAAFVEALRQGDEEAFTRLVDWHHASLCRIARMYVSSPAVADEVVQDTWLAVIQGLWAFEGRSSLKTWIVRILINQAKTRAVRERRTVPFNDAGIRDPDSPASGGSDPPDSSPSPESGLLAQEASRELRAAIDNLPPNQRIVLTMRDVEGYSSEEVCNVLGLSETNQRVILHRARHRVRAALVAYLRGDSPR